MNIFLVNIICLVFLLLGPSFGAYAQTNYQQQEEKLREEEDIKRLSGTEKLSIAPKFFHLEQGVWFNSTYSAYQNVYHKVIKDPVSSVINQDVRVWGNLTFAQRNAVYLRIKDAYSIMHTVSNYTGSAGGGDNNGPHLDMGYLLLASERNSLQVGRQYFSVGTGLAYSGVNDGVKFRSLLNNQWILKGFAAQSLPHEHSVDFSLPGYDKAANKRYFFGTELGYVGSPGLIPYIYALIQRDRSSPKPPDDRQIYRYDSEYYGVGLTGKQKILSYWLEFIRQNGRGYKDTFNGTLTLEKKPVRAYAGIAGARLDLQVLFSPSTEIEAAFGSGDKDRSSPTNTVGGNTNKVDSNFLYFGNYYAGYALVPRLSNLYVYKFDQSFKPFEGLKYFHNLLLGAKYFAYLKDRKSGGISDIEADQAYRFVGSEIDFYLHWAMNEHTTLSFRYGEFYPGEVFSIDKRVNSKYYFSSLSVSF